MTHGLVKLGDSHQVEICGVGGIKLCMWHGTKFMLKNMRHVRMLTKSLMSVRQLDDMGNNIMLCQIMVSQEGEFGHS